MKRVKLSSSYSTANMDKTFLEQYRNHEITKKQAMDKIARNNGIREISEEYFDYLFSLGYSNMEGE